MTPAPPTPPVPILLYHGVAEDAGGPSAPWVIDPGTFRAHLDALDGSGARPVTIGALVDALEAGAPVAPGTVALTFDDGFADFASGALPALAERGWAATLYVTTGAIGATTTWLPERRPMLSWSALRDVAAAGIEIGAHTVHHPQLDVLPLDRARREIVESRATLEDGLGAPVETFAYPHGYHDQRVRSLVVDAGFRSGCAVKHRFSSLRDDRFALSRVMVRDGDPADLVARWCRGEGLPTSAGGSSPIRSVAWRQVRRARARLGRAA